MWLHRQSCETRAIFYCTVVRRELNNGNRKRAQKISRSLDEWLLPRDDMLVRYMLSSCVRLSVRLSRARTVSKMSRRGIMQTTPNNISRILDFWCQRSRQNSNGDPHEDSHWYGPYGIGMKPVGFSMRILNRCVVKRKCVKHGLKLSLSRFEFRQMRSNSNLV